TVSEFLERYQAQFLTSAHKLIETAGKTTAMFESAQQQIGNKGADDLHRQGILTFPDRALDLEHLLDPLPPVLYGPSFFIQLCHAQRAQTQGDRSRPESTFHPATDN